MSADNITNQTIAMASFLPGSTSTNNLPKLNGKNYQSWKELVEIVLKLRGLTKALTESVVDEMVDLQAKLVLLETMDESHRAQVRGCKTAKEILTRLQLVYADNSAANVYRMLLKYYRYSKQPTDSISEHIGKIDEMRNQLADLGQKQSEEVYQVTLIGSLPAEYNSIMEVWELTHKEMRTTANLVARLLKKEEDLKNNDSSLHALAMRQGGRNVVKGRQQEHRQNEEKPNERRYMDSRLATQKPIEQRPMDGLSIEERKRVTTCAVCKQLGHWFRECPNRKEGDAAPAQKPVRNTSNLVRDEVNFNVGNAKLDLTNQWIVDSGATSHMSNNKSWFSELNEFETPESCAAGDGFGLQVVGRGKVKLEAEVEGEMIPITLNNVLFIPQLAANLISVGAAADQGIKTIFDRKECVMLANSCIVAKGTRFTERLYLMRVESRGENMSLLIRDGGTIGDYHRRLGHVSVERIKLLLRQLGMKVPEDNFEKCPDCPEGSGKHAAHPEIKRVVEKIGVIHADLAVVKNKVSLEGHKYYLVCKDENSEFCLVYPCKSKTEVPTVIAKMLIDAESLSGFPVSEFHSDNGSEFVNKITETLFLREKIKHFTSTPYCPQQNGRAEREIQSITNIARTILLASGLPKELWSEAVQCAAYLKNRLPTTRCVTTPFERFTGRQPYIKNIVEFGRQVHVLINGDYLTKWDARTEQGHIVGFTERRNTYRVYIPARNRVVRSCDVIFANHKTAKAPSTRSPAASVRIESQLLDPVETPVGGGFHGEGPDGNSNSVCSKETECSKGSEYSKESEYSKVSDLQQYITTMENQPVMNSTMKAPGTNTPKGIVTGERLDAFFEEYLQSSQADTDAMAELDQESVSSPQIEPFTPRQENNLSNDTETTTVGQEDTEKVSQPQPPERSTSLNRALIVNESKYIDEPRSYREALEGPNRAQWKEAIESELSAHEKNMTWKIVDRPKSGVSLSTKWVFTLKRDAAGKIERFKARLVARGFEQRHGIDYFETFSPVVSIKAIRIILALSAIKGWHVAQFDVSTAFLNGKVDEEIYIEPPDGVEVGAKQCLKLYKALYGLKQAPRCWNSMFDSLLRELGFLPTISDPCVYRGNDLIVVVYVDDGLVIGSSRESCERVIEELSKKVSLKTLSGNYFLGIEISREKGKVRLSQTRYALETVERFNLSDSNPVSTPIVDVSGLSKESAEPVITKAPYREAIGCLQYLASRTRPDILFAVNFLSRFNQAPGERHWVAVKRLLKYVKGTAELGLEYRDDGKGVEIDVYTDADWATDVKTRHSKTGMMMLIAGGPVAYKSSYQDDIAQSSTEAEYIAANVGAREVKAAVQFLAELEITHNRPTLLMDNQSAIRQIKNLDTRERSRHVDLRYHYIRQLFSQKLFDIKFVSTENQVADQLTKAVNGPRLQKLNTVSNILPSAARMKQSRSSYNNGILSNLAILCIATLMYGMICEGRSLTPTGPLLWRPTDYKVSNGVKVGSLDFTLVSVCDLVFYEEDESVFGVKGIQYKRLRERCNKDYVEQMTPAWQALVRCYPRQQERVRVKRVVPLLAVGGALFGGAAVGGGTAMYSAYSPHSSANRLDRIDAANKERDLTLKRLEEKLLTASKALQEGKDVRDDIIDQLNATAGRVERNRMAIINLAEIGPSLAWDTARVHNRIQTDVKHIYELANSCRRGFFNLKTLGEMGNIGELQEAEEKDAHLESILEVGSKGVNFKYILKLESNDTKIYQTVPFNHWINYTEPDPIFMRYAGPKYIIHNSTSDCTRGVDDPPYHIVHTSCTTSGYRDPQILSWEPALERDIERLSKPMLYQTETESYVYCLYHNIKIDGKDRACPPTPFILPIDVPFELAGKSHSVTFSTLRLQQKLLELQRTDLTTRTDEDFGREGALIAKIRLRNANSIQPGILAIDKGTLTVPIEYAMAGVGTTLAIVVLVIALTCIWNNRKPVNHPPTPVPAPTLAPPVHSEQINIYAHPTYPQIPPHNYHEVYAKKIFQAR